MSVKEYDLPLYTYPRMTPHTFKSVQAGVDAFCQVGNAKTVQVILLPPQHYELVGDNLTCTFIHVPE